MLKALLIPLLLVQATAQDKKATVQERKEAAQAKKEERRKIRTLINELGKMVRSRDQNIRIDAIKALGTIDDSNARSLLAKQILDPSEKIRNAAAAALLPQKYPVCVDALGRGAQAYVRDDKRMKWYLGKLGELDMCSGIRILLLTLKSKPSTGDASLKAIASIGCPEGVPVLVSFLKACETEERKPDFFQPLDTVNRNSNNPFGRRRELGKPVPNKTKDKTLAALAPKVRETLKKLTGHDYPEQRIWAGALARGKLRKKLGAVYLCRKEGKKWEVAAGKSKKCPFFPGKSNHGDVLLKHVPE